MLGCLYGVIEKVVAERPRCERDVHVASAGDLPILGQVVFLQAGLARHGEPKPTVQRVVIVPSQERVGLAVDDGDLALSPWA